MQYRIEVTLRDGTKRYICDQRSTHPSYAAFDVTPADSCTVAPNIKFAKEVRDAFIAFNAAWGELAFAPCVCKLRPVRPE